MNPRELFLLSPHRWPAQHSLMLANDDVAAFLNGYSALWHPAALHGAAGPAHIASPYDHELPTAGHIYAVPESPPLILPDDWDERVVDAGAVAVRATADRERTLANLREALAKIGDPPSENEKQPAAPAKPDLWALAPEHVGAFFGIGLGYALMGALFEAMEHEDVLATADFWQDVQEAVGALANHDPDACRQHLQSAAERLVAAREILYPATIHLLDICLLEGYRPPCGHPARCPEGRGQGDGHEGASEWRSLPATFEHGLAVNLVAPAALLAGLARQRPEQFERLKERLQGEQVEVLGGCYLEREDALLPVESQLWNLVKGLAVSRELLGQDIRVFARKRFAAHPQLPLLLQSVGLQRTLLVAFDDAALPTYRTTVVNWPSPDGKQVEAFTRAPYQADNPQTYFHLAHYLHQTMMQDQGATLALVHTGTPPPPWYGDLLELSRFGAVLGQWTTFTRYFNEVLAGEQATAASADDFHADYLSERTSAGLEQPVTWFAHHVRLRRRLDTIWTLAALHRGLRGTGLGAAPQLPGLEDRLEMGADVATELLERQKEAAEALAERLQARAEVGRPGYMLLNPCSFTRRVAIELEGGTGPLPVTGPLKACQVEGDRARLVVEVPPLGFAWIPRAGPPGTPPAPARLRLADARHVRNEFFEAEIDPATGGLRGLWDHRTRLNRMGQQLVFNPGSAMRASEVKLVSSGPALGEVVSQGGLFSDDDRLIAKFRQRFRAWLGRPLLELRIEIYPEQAPEGYPWHSYYGARFAWRDERAVLLRGVNGTGYITSHTRPETPDYLEIRLGGQSTVVFPGGLPFQQRHGARMVDIILIAAGETGRAFDLALGLDREHPMQTALGLITPVPLVATSKGPPQVGSSGWLCHLDAPNLMLTALRPGGDGADAVVARLLECGLYGGQAELRCPRDPARAMLLDARGDFLTEASTNGDAAVFDFSQGDFLQLRVEFS